ncbi:hypothetical protein KAX01_01710 [Candidatus Bathyarchaeota archaeon]|nr:hypothetical protein [Candidatus Bathyarchaeota archaeon]
MKPENIKFTLFSFGMGGAIASSLTSIYILTVSVMGGKSIVHENNPVLAIVEILLLAFAIATCIVATEIYVKFQKTNNNSENHKEPNPTEHAHAE